MQAKPHREPEIQARKYQVGEAPTQRGRPLYMSLEAPPASRMNARPTTVNAFGFGRLEGDETDRLVAPAPQAGSFGVVAMIAAGAAGFLAFRAAG